MTITKPKRKSTSDSTEVEAFIAGAPDTVSNKKGVKKGKKEQISLTINPSLLAQVDALAERLGQSRAAVINMAIVQAVETGLSITGLKMS